MVTLQADGCSRSQTRTWTARDACGNTSTASRTVTWTTDLTAPTLTTGGTTTTLGCNPSANDIGAALGTATATDACGNPTVTSSDGNVTSDGCSRSQTRTWTARDACGNTATASRTVSWTADLTAHFITSGGTTTTLGCNPSANDIGAALGTASATDACGNPTVTSSDGNVTSDGCSRSQTRTWTARDACGNTATASRTVTWTSDNTAPVITSGGTTNTLGCNPSANDIGAALGTASATDACGNPTVTSSDGSVTSNGCSRSQTRTWTARDACGNTATASRTVTWTSDNTAPVITSGGTTNTLGCNPSAGDINGALGTASATDACGNPTVTSSDGSVTSDGCSRSQTRTWTARDACGNTATASRTVTWTSDNTAPVITSGGTTNTLGCNPSAVISMVLPWVLLLQLMHAVIQL
jgi:predicted RNA-binding Zn ribbon-like protein